MSARNAPQLTVDVSRGNAITMQLPAVQHRLNSMGFLIISFVGSLTQRIQLLTSQDACWILCHQFFAPQGHFVHILLPQDPDLGKINPAQQEALISRHLISSSCCPKHRVDLSWHLHVSHKAAPTVALHELVHNPGPGCEWKYKRTSIIPW